ncbi:MAG: 50S ribosomal protein L1 [Candidatus Moranbacteria bacterium CG_4_10_14_3_um_filter_45_9]|nr:MAG: 50S ribosomal protein L1 [Candidatus Moranbacteria bacterium CG2_30_45_14]PIX89966.1 MAG: 50S ribosomal protein L1 [Candidatus Moranbacteria bacterium CG_4_10_14_3_um_filter_45_9]PJA85264.1 MAG: 50S ribosomal protein L1 [Candidatus Moranbacteria bacterium CG_4_9_14_3_um_filter_45_14]
MSRGKNYNNVLAKAEVGKEYTPEEAIAFIKENKLAKFDEAVEVHIRLGINTKKSDEMVRVTVILPQGTGRAKKVAVITNTKEKEAQEAKADLIGGEELIADIKNGKVVPGQAFDVLLATPEMMPKLALVAKILGQKGMMPSPKTETVTVKIKETVEMLKKGKRVSFKNDDTGNVHQVIGKLSFTVEALLENYKTFRETLDRAKPENMKGKLIKSISVCSTMGPSLSIKI